MEVEGAEYLGMVMKSYGMPVRFCHDHLYQVYIRHVNDGRDQSAERRETREREPDPRVSDR